MNKYRKKPIVIEAMQFTGNVSPFQNIIPCGRCAEDGTFYIQTREGEMHVSLNDYVVKGTHGEFYPVKPHIFEANYEKVSEHD